MRKKKVCVDVDFFNLKIIRGEKKKTSEFYTAEALRPQEKI